MNTTNAIHIPARQCGKTLMQELESGLFEAARMNKTASLLHVGEDLHRALKSLPLENYTAPHKDGSVPDRLVGIPVKMNPILPPDGWAFIDRKGTVIRMGTGTLKPEGQEHG